MQNDMINKIAELYGKAKQSALGRTLHSNLERNMFIADYLVANDVVPVVRCRDCKHYDIRNAKCLLHSELADQYSSGFNFEMYADDYCSCGGKEGEGK